MSAIIHVSMHIHVPMLTVKILVHVCMHVYVNIYQYRFLILSSRNCAPAPNGLWIMFFRPKAQRWDQQGHSAPKKRKKEMRYSKKKHPTKLS